MAATTSRRRGRRKASERVQNMLVVLAERPRRLQWLHIDFLTLHWAYFIFTSLIVAVIFWAASRDGFQVSFVDSLFFTVSAITEAGLNPVALSRLNTFQQVLLWLLICVGSVPPVSWVLIYVRKRAYERRYGSAIRALDQELWRCNTGSEATLNRSASAVSNVSYYASTKIYREYQSLCLLCWLVPLYFVLFQLLGCVGLGAWIAINSPGTALQEGISPWWDGIFLGASAFNNSGMSVQDSNLVAFNNDAYVLLTIGLLILAGNTCYPVFLRGIVWSLWKLLPTRRFEKTKDTLRFLLDNPRDVYTHLFPTRTTWLLLLSVIALNLIDWAAFEILNINNPVIDSLPPVARVLDGLIQAFAVRFGGFYVAPIADLNIALLVLYVLMMYISAFPVTMSMRSTNVYDASTEVAPKQSDDDPLFIRFLHRSLPSSISHHVSRQLSHDLWYLCLSVFFIMLIESPSFVRDPVNYSVFNVIFEVVSAYGTVGISMGLPNHSYSFCGGWHAMSKLILATVALRGRHRGLPDIIDRAVMMPGAKVTTLPDEAVLPSGIQSELESSDGQVMVQVTTVAKGKEPDSSRKGGDEGDDYFDRPRKRKRTVEEMV